MSSGNQRDFYRVECRALIAARVLGTSIPHGATAASFFGESMQLSLGRELMRIDQEYAQVLHGIADRDRNLGNYLHGLNRKIDALARHVLALAPQAQEDVEQTVSISEGGIAFRSGDALAAGTALALNITLLPSRLAIAVFARVVGTQASADGSALVVTTHFEHLQDAERQLIARHVMQVQMAEQRRRSGRD